ncbi:MAG: CRTAC1 family protein [Planctomycetota bacterium]
MRTKLRLATLGSIIVLVIPALTSKLSGQLQFTDVSTASGIGPYYIAGGLGAGVFAEDFDRDGDIDFFVPNTAGVASQLYRNLGAGQFDEVAALYNVGSYAHDRSGLWFDANGDQRLDLLVLSDCVSIPCSDEITIQLYSQLASGQFADVTSSSGLLSGSMISVAPHRAGAAAADINRDGYLDLCFANWDGAIHLFRNNRDGTFADITATSGLAGVNWYWQPVFHDFNRDGYPDLYVTVDFNENELWINNRDGTFVEVAGAAGVANLMNDMGITLGDCDNDGDIDMYITNIYESGQYNMLYRNNSTSSELSFEDVSVASGVQIGFWGWGTTFFDANNDGWLDLAATNGWWLLPWNQDPSRFFLNLCTTPPTFAEISTQVGYGDSDLGSCLISFDADRDGDLDMLQTTLLGGPLRLFSNNTGQQTNAPHWLVVRPRMNGPNHWAIGAIVRLTSGSLTQMRMIHAGTSFFGQEPAEAHFGLGPNTLVDSVVVEWPDGTVTSLSDVAADHIVDVTHGGFGDLNADGALDSFDVALFLDCWLSATPRAYGYASACAGADRWGDGFIDCDDWQAFATRCLEVGGFTLTLSPALDCDGDGMLDSCQLFGDSSLDCNGNGVLDSCEIASGAVDLNGNGRPDECELFVRGDFSGDGVLAINDAIGVLGYLFLGNSSSCSASVDFDASGAILINDVILLLSYLFLSGAPPSAPWPTCGVDMTQPPSEVLSCETQASCL